MAEKLKRRVLNSEKPPKHLSLEARRIWTQLNSELELPSDALLTLRIALECFDRGQEARKILDSEGLTTTNKQTGVARKHPCCEIEKNAIGQFLAAMRLLGFDSVAVGPIGRPGVT